MKRQLARFLAALAISLAAGGDSHGRGFGGGGGGFHGGGFGGGVGGGGLGGGLGGDRVGGYGGGFSGYGGDRVGGLGGDRVGGFGNAYGGNFGADRVGGMGDNRFGNWAGLGALDHNPAGGGLRPTIGPDTAGGRNWQSAFAGTRFPTDAGLSHYSAFNAAGLNHTTANWSHGYMANRAGNVRSNFGYYNCFHPAWYANHPGCWFAAGWAAGSAWTAATWGAVYPWCAFAVAPIDYDYGSSVVYQNNDVYVDGQDVATAQQYAQQATALADQGQQADAPTTAQWKPLGVFALVQGDESTSNNLFQLAVNQQGIIRGNYYDGLMDTTTPVYGSVDQKTQRAAWTIGKKNDRVFEAGIYNLTKSETPVLVHFGADRTQQWLLVRMQSPQQSAQ